MPESLTPHSVTPEDTDEVTVGNRQFTVGKEWARIYADPSLPLDNRAEMVLRNPTTYLQDIDLSQLPQDLQNGWRILSDECEQLAETVTTTPTRWGEEVSGLEKILTLVSSNNVNAGARKQVGDIIGAASGLFMQSVTYAPGKTQNYMNNINGAEALLSRPLPTSQV